MLAGALVIHFTDDVSMSSRPGPIVLRLFALLITVVAMMYIINWATVVERTVGPCKVQAIMQFLAIKLMVLFMII